jgi:cytidyltransferase-like protein
MRIVVNGCFDLFHEGHKYILLKALEWAGDCGSIKVLLNSDFSVSQLKGSSRPVDTFQRRFNNIYAFVRIWSQNHMSYPEVSIRDFDTETQLSEMINEFRPDIILKGNDRFDIRKIVGSDRWPVCILPRLPGYSTTEIIDGRTI